MIAIFTYGFSVAKDNFEEKGVELHTLSDYDHLIKQASDTNYIKEAQLNTLIAWKNNPAEWKK